MANMMDYRALSEELCKTHFQHAKVLNKVNDDLSYSGEDGIIVWLRQRGRPCFAVDIVENFSLSAGRVANIVRQLETKGYIYRMQDGTDLRKRAIALTDEGAEYAERRYEHIIDSQMKLFDKIGYEDSVELIRIMKKLTGTAC